MALTRWSNIDPGDIEQIFDGERWRDVIQIPEPAEVGILSWAGYPQILIPVLAAELAGQGQSTWVTAWALENLPAFRFDPASASAQVIHPGAGGG